MATPAYKTRLRVTSQTGVTMTDQAMNNGGSGLVYKTTNAARNFWDPRTAAVIKDGATTLTLGVNYTVDYLLGTVTLAAPPAGSVTVTGKYLPKIALPACKSYSLNLSKAQLETTVYGDDFIDRISGLGDASGTLERLETGLEDYTTGESFWDALAGGVPVGLEERYDDAVTTYCTRLYVQLESLPQSAAPGDLATAVVGFQGVTWGASDKSISIGDPA
jgi:hypothetical protein